jgi:hypothetical protein
MLLARDAPGDPERAEMLLREALTLARDIGMPPLETQISQLLGAASEDLPVASPHRTLFRMEGEYWSIAFAGSAFRLRDARGLRHLSRLLAAPGQEFHALDLVRLAEGPRSDATQPGAGLDSAGLGDMGAVLDPQAKAAYRRRLAELQEDVEEADRWNDPERGARARTEIEFLTTQLAASVGLGGRDRPTGSSAERARLNVTRAIRSAMARIAENDPGLGRHLDTTIKTGIFCSYTPDPRLPIDWQL